MTRLELLALWFERVPRDDQIARIVALYQAAPAGVQDAMFAAFKGDLVALLDARKTQLTGRSAVVDTELGDVNSTT